MGNIDKEFLLSVQGLFLLVLENNKRSHFGETYTSSKPVTLEDLDLYDMLYPGDLEKYAEAIRKELPAMHSNARFNYEISTKTFNSEQERAHYDIINNPRRQIKW